MAEISSRLKLLKPQGGDYLSADTLAGNFETLDKNAGAFVCTSTTRPAQPYEGQLILETDTGRTLVRSGGDWVTPFPVRRSGTSSSVTLTTSPQVVNKIGGSGDLTPAGTYLLIARIAFSLSLANNTSIVTELYVGAAPASDMNAVTRVLASSVGGTQSFTQEFSRILTLDSPNYLSLRSSIQNTGGTHAASSSAFHILRVG